MTRLNNEQSFLYHLEWEPSRDSLECNFSGRLSKAFLALKSVFFGWTEMFTAIRFSTDYVNVLHWRFDDSLSIFTILWWVGGKKKKKKINLLCNQMLITLNSSLNWPWLFSSVFLSLNNALTSICTQWFVFLVIKKERKTKILITFFVYTVNQHSLSFTMAGKLWVKIRHDVWKGINSDLTFQNVWVVIHNIKAV